jgi:hypothetical protein
MPFFLPQPQTRHAWRKWLELAPVASFFRLWLYVALGTTGRRRKSATRPDQSREPTQFPRWNVLPVHLTERHFCLRAPVKQLRTYLRPFQSQPSRAISLNLNLNPSRQSKLSIHSAFPLLVLAFASNPSAFPFQLLTFLITPTSSRSAVEMSEQFFSEAWYVIDRNAVFSSAINPIRRSSQCHHDASQGHNRSRVHNLR